MSFRVLLQYLSCNCGELAARECLAYHFTKCSSRFCIYSGLPITLASGLRIQPIKSNVELEIQPQT